MMAIFCKLRNMKKAADEQIPADSLWKYTPYKHVPTHAAIDSLACAPPGCRHMEDRKAIQAQSKRRCQMSMPASGLSLVSALDPRDSHNTNGWTVTTTDQLNTHPPMTFVPDFEAMHRLSSFHELGNDEARYAFELY